MIQMTVVNGPESGKCLKFDGARITLGRNEGNDFSVQDNFVSSWHGEIVQQKYGYVYYDLKSRHGTTVSLRNQVVKLKDDNTSQSCYLSDGARLQLGQTVVQLDVQTDGEEPRRSARSGRFSRLGKTNAGFSTSGLYQTGFGATGFGQPSLKASGFHQTSGFSSALTGGTGFGRALGVAGDTGSTCIGVPIDLLTRNFARKDPRLRLLMRLSGQLNGLNRLPAIMDLIVETTFEAFPLTHCFAINLLQREGGLSNYVTRFATEWETHPEEEVISAELLEQVVAKQESVLFTRDKDHGLADETFLQGPSQSGIYVPLLGQHSMLGVFAISSKNAERQFDHNDLELLSVLASNVAFTLERAQLTENIYNMFEGFVRASVVAIEARDPTTAGHSERVAAYTVAIAETVNEIMTGSLGDIQFSDEELTELRYAALLHDFGKVGVRESVLSKATRLTDTRFLLISQRFETLKESHARWIFSEKFRELAKAGRIASLEQLEALEKQHAFVEERLDSILKFVDELRRMHRLNGMVAEKVEELRGAHLQFGPKQVKLFEEEELRDLTVAYGTLNATEWEDMRSHAAKSEYFLNQIPWSCELGRIPCIAGAHHEKLDGSGYPSGLTEDAILPQVRILTISDIFDALTANDRPYRRAATIAEAIEILRMDANSNRLDARMVDLFAERVIHQIEYIVPRSKSNPRS